MVRGRPEGNYSTIEIIDPSRNGYAYALDEGGKYGPEEALWTFEGTGETDFYSPRISGAQSQPNGNILICSGNQARIFEIDSIGNLVWDYINPVSQNGPVSQGSLGSSRDMFRAYRYSPDYAAFDDKDLTARDPLEIDPFPNMCMIYDIKTSVYEPQNHYGDLNIYPNPASQTISIDCENKIEDKLMIIDMTGRVLLSLSGNQNNHLTLDVSPLNPGMYILQIGNITGRLVICP